ncbi:MAG: pilus assembly protein PilM [Polyangiales bacterium]
MARILGLDIERDAIRGVLLKTAFRRTELDRFVEVPLTEAPGSPGHLPELHSALQNLVRSLGQSSPDIVHTAIDGAQASLRVIELPLAAAKRAAEVLPFELESMLPFEVTDAIIDYQPIDTKDGQLRLLAAAALRERVREHLALFHGSSLEPRELAVGAAALDGLRALCPELGVGHSVVLELGEDESDFCALVQGRAAFARTLSVGVSALPDASQGLFAAIRQTIAAYRASGAENPDKLYLGGRGELRELAVELAEQTGLEVELLALPSTEASQTPLPLTFTRAAALAGRALKSGKRINLRTGEFSSSRARGDMASQLNLLAMCGVAVLLCLVFALKARQSVLVDEQNVLVKQLGETTERVFGKREIDAAKVETLLKSPPNENPLPRFDAYDALAALSDAVDKAPDEIVHEVRHVRIDLAEDKKEGKVELQGGLASIEQRDAIVTQLEAHGCFRDIQRGRTSPGRSGDQINYQIEAKVQCPGEGTPKKRKNKSANDE